MSGTGDAHFDPGGNGNRGPLTQIDIDPARMAAAVELHESQQLDSTGRIDSISGDLAS